MRNQFHKRPSFANVMFFLAGIFVMVLGLVFSVTVQPAEASPPVQDGYPVGTETATITLTPTVTLTGGATLTPTATATRVGTLPAPARTGTPTALIPVTGADFTRQDGQVNVGMWVAIWLLGLILIGFGLRSRLSKR
jgi:heme/copper-type cytochrome/quinol oxidase subunit 2